MENNSPRAQSAHCSSHLHYAAAAAAPSPFRNCPPAWCTCTPRRAHRHTQARAEARVGALPHWERSLGPGSPRGQGSGRGAGAFFSSAACLIQGRAFSCLPSLISFLARYSGSPGLPRASPLGPACVCGGAQAAVTRGSQPQARLLGEDTCSGGVGGGGGKRPAFQEEAPGAPPLRALQDFPGPGAGAAESRDKPPASLCGPSGPARPLPPPARRSPRPVLCPFWLQGAGSAPWVDWKAGHWSLGDPPTPSGERVWCRGEERNQPPPHPPGGQVGSGGAEAQPASAVWFPLRLQAINKLPLGRMSAASKGGFPRNRAGGLRSRPGAGPSAGGWSAGWGAGSRRAQRSARSGRVTLPSPAGLGSLRREARGRERLGDL